MLKRVFKRKKKSRFALPKKFHERVLELEKKIDMLQENTPQHTLQTLLHLYGQAIEYYGSVDKNEICVDLNARMQQLLVRPEVLEALETHHANRLKIEA